MEFKLNKIIDQTFLKPVYHKRQLFDFCEEAIAYDFVSVALLPGVIRLVKPLFSGSGVNIMAAISYPRGLVPLELKRKEVLDAVDNGATELDMVLDIQAIKEKKYEVTEREIEMLKREKGAFTGKVILEITLLSDEEIAAVCAIASRIGIDFVKTSTGYCSHAATLHAVEVMRRNVSGLTKVKAAGGIGNLEKTVLMLKAGAERIGTSSGPAIVNELKAMGKDTLTIDYTAVR